MEAQKAVDELATYLLGDDYYIVDPVSESQANNIIIDEIKSRYGRFTESPTNRWRNSRCNRRCKFCKHYIEFSAVKGTCRAKDQPVYGRSRRPFCKVFQIKPFYEKEEK